MKEINDEVYFWHGEKQQNFLQVDFGCAQQKQEVSISLQYLWKNIGNKVALLPTDIYEGFLHYATIILDVCKQACPKQPE